MNYATLGQSIAAGAGAQGIALPPAAVERLTAFIGGLERWNKVYNLTAVRDPEAMVPHHILDSLAVLSWLGGDTVLDVGSGAGLPGIPLAIASPEMRFTLLDSSAKRARFMRQMKAELNLDNVDIVHDRAENYQGAAFDCVLARACASLSDLLRMVGRLCAAEGRVLALKGRYPERELNEVAVNFGAGYRVVEVTKLSVPGLHAERHLVWLQPTTATSG